MNLFKKFLFGQLLVTLLITFIGFNLPAIACSSFKLQKGDGLVYGHNLNEADIGVPGLIFINKRGIFKTGRSWSEIINKNQSNLSSLVWISCYGSVTFNNFGRDFPDGGMNEEGLFIWEMNEDTEYPKNENLPKLNQMNWMQYILDNYSTTEEAIKCASEIEIDGWGWHFFVGDAKGNTAAIEFLNGKVVIHTGNQMPVAGLFNNPYERELELLKFYKGFGGNYEPTLDDPKVPRFVKTAVLTRDYHPDDNMVDYGLMMLDRMMVNDIPEWSILFDVRTATVYLKTRINPEVKTLSMTQIDFTNQTPALILNMDVEHGGNVLDKFEPFTNEKMAQFIKEQMFPILPKAFYIRGGLTLEEYLERTSTHTDLAKTDEAQFFKGTWINNPDKSKEEMSMTMNFESNGESIHGSISNGKEWYTMDHLGLVANRLKFTFKTKGGTLLEIQGEFREGKMIVDLYGIEDHFAAYTLAGS